VDELFAGGFCASAIHPGDSVTICPGPKQGNATRSCTRLDVHQCDAAAIDENSLHSRNGRNRMDTSDMLFLGLVFVAFAAFFITVMWVLHDDVRNRAARAARGANGNANDETAAKAARAA
jgi:hypothetical protein